MNRLVRWTQNYLLCALPFVIACMAWSSVRTDGASLLWEVLSWNLMLWFAVLIGFLAILVVVPEARERTLKRLAHIQERDEREQFITGRASRATFLSSLSVLVLLLFFSIFSLNVSRNPQPIDGKTRSLSIGLHFTLWEPAKEHQNAAGQIVATRDIPFSKSAMLLGLILWQLAVFHISARKEN